MRLDVGPDRVEGHEELPGDRGTGEVNVEKAQDLELSFAERVARDPRTAGATSAEETVERERDEAVRAAAALREIVETHLDDKERTATHPAFTAADVAALGAGSAALPPRSPPAGPR